MSAVVHELPMRWADLDAGRFVEIFRDGTVHARASSIMIGFDLETQRSRPYSEEERAAFAVLSR